MKRFVMTAAAVFLSSLPARAAEGRWQEYVYRESGFSANFPEAPQSHNVMQRTSQTPSGEISERVYSVDEGGVIYSVGVADFSQSRRDPDLAVREALAALIGNGKVAVEISLEIDSVHGTEYVVIGSDGTRYTDGIFYFKEQLYQVKVVYPVDNSDPAGSSGVGFFMAHFRFLEPF
jgi:hypothetical protein